MYIHITTFRPLSLSLSLSFSLFPLRSLFPARAAHDVTGCPVHRYFSRSLMLLHLTSALRFYVRCKNARVQANTPCLCHAEEK